MYDLVFTLDLMRCLGEELAWGLLSQDVSLLVGAGNLVRRVRLAEAEL